MEQIEGNLMFIARESHVKSSFTNMVNPCSLLWKEELAAKFMCRVCNKTFYNAKALHNHMKIEHDGEEPKRINENYNNFNDLCGFKFILKDKNNTNFTMVHDGLMSRTFEEDTTYLFVKVEGASIASMKDSVKKTKLGNTPVDLRGPFTCTFPSTLRPDLQCRKIFFNCCDYSLHYREEHTKRRKAALRCQVCEKRLDRDFYPSTLTAPIQAVNRLTFSCRLCGQIFLSSTDFDEHNRLLHAKMKPHQCSICSKRFTQQGSLQQHMRMHTGIRPFSCSFCPKAFTQKAGLDQHLRTHTKVKPFKCVICSKSFSQSVHLRQHMRTHTNIQPFECYICHRRFKQSSHLNFHMRSHMEGAESFVAKNYPPAVEHQTQMDFLKLSNLQPIQDGDTLYYAAELSDISSNEQNPFGFQTEIYHT